MTAHAKPPGRRWLDVARALFGLLIVAVVVVSFVQDRQRVECQRAWFEQATEAIADRSAAAGRTNQDLRSFADASLSALEQPQQAPGPIRDALLELRASLDQAEATRQASPIPQPPEC